MRQYAWAVVVAGLVGTGGCEVYESPPPRRHIVYYQDAPPPPPPPPVVVDEAPPPLVEVVPVAPGPDYFWVGGRYYREHGAWVWHRGYYDHRHHY